MINIPSYGDHMTLQEFKDACYDGLFTDDDGSGNLATKTHMSELHEIYPSMMTHAERTIPKEFTHVVWFNK